MIGNWIRPARRLRIYARDSWTCQICGANLKHDPSLLELDHIKERNGKERVSEGVDNSDANLRTLCRTCNRGRKMKERIR